MKNIILAGMPGSGKTTVSLFLSELTGRPVTDTDAEIVKRHGEIAAIFASRGEEYFRDLESEVCERLGRVDGRIVATGGGCLLRAENVAALKQNGRIVYLKTSPEQLIDRLEGDTSRPLLTGDVKARLRELYEARRTVYENAADYIVGTDGMPPKEIAKKILEFGL